MIASFNLVEKPWVPCVAPDGSRQELSLKESLLSAGQLRELRDESPLVTAALHRLMLAILHRVFGPRDDEHWASLWSAESFPREPLEEYFKKWRGRFDLFDPDQPFFQVKGFETEAPSGINRLAQELARGNNAMLFDHTSDGEPPPFTPAQAVRYIVAEQAFAVGGGKSATGNTTHAPLVSGAAIFLQGRSLRETLLLNLINYDGNDRPFPALADLPEWERDRAALPPLEKRSEKPSGHLDLLTWQSRSLRLHVEQCDGSPIVRRVSYAQGRRFAPAAGFYDPAFAIRRDPKNGDRPIRLSEGRAVWRDSAALFQFAESRQFRGPLAVTELTNRRLEVGTLPRTCHAAVIGLCTDKAKVNLWRYDRLPMPVEYVADRDLVLDLRKSLEMAEEVAASLRSAVRASAQIAISPTDPAKADKDRVANLVASLAPDRIYWARLESPFRVFLAGLPGTPTHRVEACREWFERTLYAAACDAFNRSAGTLDMSARALRAAVAGEVALAREFARLRSQVFRDVLPGPEATTTEAVHAQ